MLTSCNNGSRVRKIDRFVGRDEELAALSVMLGEWRLVTLTGPAGMGKTCLALQLLDLAAVATSEARPAGAFLVDLAPLRDPTAVPQALASALGVGERAGAILVDTVTAHIGETNVILVLDNCEHLVGACAELAERLLVSCSGVTILATSQEALGVAGERVWPVPPLSVPTPGETSAEALTRHGSVQLFVERARASGARFVLTDDVAAAVGEICRRLDGIPLAIELAAARLDVLSPPEIATRLDDRFGLLSAGRRTSPERHRSLEAALCWSHDLLCPAEQALLRRLSVFVGGFPLSAAEQVCAGGEVDGARLFDLLARLVARSLVGSDTTGTQARYRLLETMRHFAWDRLVEAGEAASLSARHARWCLTLVEDAESGLCGPDQEAWLERLDVEHDNLLAALGWALADGQTESALRVAGALSLFWRVRGHFSEGRRWLSRALAAGEGAPIGVRAKALWGAGLLAAMLGEFAAAVALAKQGLALARQAGDDQAAARCLLVLGNARLYVNGPAAALVVLQDSAAEATKAGDRWCLDHALAMCGWAEARRGEFSRARPLFEEALAMAQRAGDLQGLGIALNGLGYVAMEQGDYALAEGLLEEAVGVSERLGDSYGATAANMSLARLATGRGRYERARELLVEVFGQARRSGSAHDLVDTLCLLATVALYEGDAVEAGELFDQAAHTAERCGATSGHVLLGKGQALLAAGNVPGGRRLLEEAVSLARSLDDRHAEAMATYHLARAHRAVDDRERAASLHHEALRVRHEIGERPGVAASLEAVAGLLCETGRPADSARLLAAAESLRVAGAFVRPAVERARWEEDLAALRGVLSEQELAEAWVQGSALPADQAVYLAAKGRGAKSLAQQGWDSLTRSERQVVALVAEGLSNREIAERLFISPRTVQSHLTHVFPKVAVSSRQELARALARRNQEWEIT